MTWIVGTSFGFGYAVAVSDIRVQLANGTEKDCLQKIYPVGPKIAVGFSGSVAIGFSMIDRLRALFHTDRKGVAWDPTEVASSWPEYAREVFQSSAENERKLHCRLMMLGAHPTENAGDMPWPRCYVYRFRAPQFDPELAAPYEVVSIGSGSGIDNYSKKLRSLSDNDAILQLETHRTGGSALGLLTSITETIEKHPVKGISPHLHICLVTRTHIELGKNDRPAVSGVPDWQLTMPPVATSLNEFHNMFATAGVAEAVC